MKGKKMDMLFSEFQNAFTIDETKYHGLAQHENNSIGFSTYRFPSADLQSKLKIEPRADYRTLFAAYVNRYKSSVGNLQPIVLRFVFCLYENDTYILDFSKLKNYKQLPIDIMETERYFYDVKKKLICKEDGTAVDTKKIIEDLYQQHIKLTKLMVNLWFLVRRFLIKKVIFRVSDWIINRLNVVLFFFTGKRYIKSRVILSSDGEVLSTLDSKREVDFFGLKVKIIPLFTYSLLHLTGFGVFWYLNIKPGWIHTLLEFNLLTAVYVVFSYVMYTKATEWILTPIFKFFDNIRSFALKKVIKP